MSDTSAFPPAEPRSQGVDKERAMIEEGRRVRILMQRTFADEPPTIFRGDLKEATNLVLRIVGRRYTKIFDSASNRAEEKPLDAADKNYVVPLVSIRFFEIIEPGSPEEELDQRIRSEEIMQRKGGLALID